MATRRGGDPAPQPVRLFPRTKHPMLRWAWFQEQLRAGKYPSARAYAERFEITQRTAYRDVEYFREQMRLPIGYDPKRRGYRLLEPTAPLSSIVTVTEGEIVALYMGQRVLEQYEGTQFGALLAHAFEKISSLLPDEVSIDLDSLRQGFSFHVGPPGRLEVEIFTRASRAVTERKALAIEYLTQSRGEVTRRVVDPYHLHHHGGAWYLIGYCHRTRAVRTFNLSRVSRAAVQKRSFEQRGDFDLTAYLREGFSMMRGEKMEQVSVRFDAYQARWIAERTWHPSERRERHADGSLTLHFTLSGLDGVKRWVMSYGPHAEVLAPASLRREVASEVRRMAANYRTAGR